MARRESRTPIFSFDTPSRDRSSTRNRSSTARDIARNIVEPGTPRSTTTTATTELTTSTVTTEITSTPVSTPSTTQSRTVVTPSSHSGTSFQGSSCPDFSREIKTLREQQKKLQASSARIEEMLKEITTSKDSDVKRVNIPRALSTLVHDVYHKIVEEEHVEWNFLASFDDLSNKEINSLLVRNIAAVIQDGQYNVTLIKRAARTYFKTQKNTFQRRRTGKQESASKTARKRQRRHNKAHARLRALNLSKTLDEPTKEKIRPVLNADYMSSDESEVEAAATQGEESSDSENETASNGKKRLCRHRLPWRSQELQRVIESLDRKLERRRSDRAKAMCLEIIVGSDSQRGVPNNAPEWAIELFSS